MVTMMNGWLKGLVPHRAGMTDGLFIVDIYIISDIYEKINDLSLILGYFSGSARGEMLFEELATGKLSYPDEDL